MTNMLTTAEVESLAHNPAARRRVAYDRTVASSVTETGTVYVTVDGPLPPRPACITEQVGRVVSEIGVGDGTLVAINRGHSEVSYLRFAKKSVLDKESTPTLTDIDYDEAAPDADCIASYNEWGYHLFSAPVGSYYTLALAVEDAFSSCLSVHCDYDEEIAPDIDARAYSLTPLDVRALARGASGYFYWSDRLASAATYYDSGIYVWFEIDRSRRDATLASLAEAIDKCYASCRAEEGLHDGGVARVTAACGAGEVAEVLIGTQSEATVLVSVSGNSTGEEYFAAELPVEAVGYEVAKALVDAHSRYNAETVE